MNIYKYLFMTVLLLSMSLPVMTVNAATSRQSASDTPTATATMTETATMNNTSTLTATSTSTATVTITTTMIVATPTPMATDTITPTAIATNTPTASATLPTTNTPIQTALPGTRTHIVRPGETLFCIGRAYKVWPFAIAEVNNIWWPYTIYPNQKLTIPTTIWSPIPVGPTCSAQFSPSTPASTATITPTASTTNCRTTYVVRGGDTLYRIAIRYGTNYIELARVNQISNARLIYIGQRLCIP